MSVFRIQKRMEIAGSHCLELPYESKCQNIHGHNWIIHVICETERLTEYGMVIDFTDIKKHIHDALDHKNLNDVFSFNPTAENIAEWICGKINEIIIISNDYDVTCKCVEVEVQESEGNIATYYNTGEVN